MKLNIKKFEEYLVHHKETMIRASKLHQIQPMFGEDVHELLNLYHQSKVLALARSEFKCEKCGCEERLSFHHLVLKKAKYYMRFDRYISARHYWNNVLILCWKCHREYHGVLDNGKTEKETNIPEEYKQKVKDRFFTD